MDNELLVKSIRTLCKKNNISISQLENELNFGAGLISRWIKSSPSIDKIVNIADYFNTSIDETIGRTINAKQNGEQKFIDKLYNETINNSIVWVDQTDLVPKLIDSDTNIEDDGYEYFELYTTQYNQGTIYLYTQYDKEKGIINDIDIQLYIQPDKTSELVIQEYDDTKLYDLWHYIQIKFYGKLDETKAEEFKNDFINNKSKKTIESFTDEQLLQITQNMIEMEPDLTLVFEKLNDPEFSKFLTTLESPKIQERIKIAQRLKPYAHLLQTHEIGYTVMEHDKQGKNNK